MTLVKGTNSAGTSLSGYMCFTIDEGLTTQEFVCGTASSTAITSMIRGIDPIDGDLEVASLKKAHRIGSSVKMTDYPVLGIIARILNGQETLPNRLEYASTSQVYSSSTQLISKGYVDTNSLSITTTSPQTILSPTTISNNATVTGTLDVVGQSTFTLPPQTSTQCATGNDLCNKTYVDAQIVAGGVVMATTTRGTAKISVDPASTTNPIVVGDNDPRVPTQAENDALAGTSGTPSGTNKYVTNADTATSTTADKIVRANSVGKIDTSFYNSGKFGGTGTDGALSITSGTTTIDLATTSVVTKNYSSISITGTGTLMFSNPHGNGSTIILKSQGDCTFTSSAAPMIDASGMGAPGGAAVGTNLNGDAGTVSYGIGPIKISAGGGGKQSNGAHDALATQSFNSKTSIKSIYLYKLLDLIPGSGGGSGSTNGGSTASGAGGRGGGALYIECGGALNFTTTSGISVAGKNGSNSNGATTSGGGGGGGAGTFRMYAGTITANTGTVTIAGGTGGTGAGDPANADGGDGGGSVSNDGGSGDGSTTGGTGAAGYSLITTNTEF